MLSTQLANFLRIDKLWSPESMVSAQCRQYYVCSTYQLIFDKTKRQKYERKSNITFRKGSSQQRFLSFYLFFKEQLRQQAKEKVSRWLFYI